MIGMGGIWRVAMRSSTTVPCENEWAEQPFAWLNINKQKEVTSAKYKLVQPLKYV